MTTLTGTWQSSYGTDPGDPDRALTIGGVGDRLAAGEVTLGTFVGMASATGRRR